MFQAFLLGFWTLWSTNRDIHALSESLSFTIISVLISAGITFELPHIDGAWFISIAVLWAYVACVFGIVNRFADSFMGTLVMAAASAIGYYQLAEYIPKVAAGLFA
ncbi:MULTISPECIES: hypothetical protein [unclassified Neisseria]|uniref:hypothetical protein n=1 Tax=unclassified Neisseria TaxID=2623750 RepID=UPI002666B295|nr:MULTISPECIES: hypothetical protein [unclassified Neisseria]MDO1510621.1 hypothetical protein [Neisseria sp. MVDL19-042950]MDO1516255.1 hypothetical protein [Neisseria sp. MVDL18-041461]MDO1564273.1 hypothetical protein [Neisseria sp. MVDL20-010259]